MSQHFEKLKTLLKELFQLDQPELDFGFYRIMHAKSAEVTQFLEKDLLPQVKAAFAQYQPANKAVIEKDLADLEDGIKKAGMDPAQSPKVRELEKRLKEDAVDLDALEAEVYDHLYKFFRRYYSEGDFLSRRVYKPGVYAIPYEGEEVKLHWANADQYYIKTSEYLRDYAFRLRPDDDRNPMRVRFRLVGATEGEHGNVKEAESKGRVFVLAADDFMAEEVGDKGKELLIRFEYRPATLADWPEVARASKRKPPAQKELLVLVETRLLAVTDPALLPWVEALGQPHVRSDGEQADYSSLRAHFNRYTARNTFDYFIHKDLGSFLRRELDFYIKNELVHLDDIESEAAPRVEQYLSKVRIIRRIGGKVIEFLAQLENFQRKLWLKKKFVVDTQYCISLDRIPKELYEEIAANDGQREEWVRLYAIDEIKEDLAAPGYSSPLTPDFIKTHATLILNTHNFRPDFVMRLVDANANLDQSTGGILAHSENSQALYLFKRRFGALIDAAYLDPPYNTDSAPIAYKNAYRRSSWAAFMHARLEAVRQLLSPSGVLCTTIDDYQHRELMYLLEDIFGAENLAGVIAIRSNPSGRPIPSGLAQAHEYAVFVKASSDAALGKLPRRESQARRYREKDKDGAYMWELFRKRGSGSERSDRPTLYYPVYSTGSSVRVPRMSWNDAAKEWEILAEPYENETVLWPIDANGVQRRWRGTWMRIRDHSEHFRVRVSPDGEHVLYYKFRPASDGVVATTSWVDSRYSATEHGTGVLRDMFTEYHLFDFPKSIYAVEDCLRVAGVGDVSDAEPMILDCFAGSGTTGHAVMNLNRQDESNRRFLLVEAESYFDSVLLPRLLKAAYTREWKSAKPVNRLEGLSVCWKYIRLESYEDTLNNLEVRRTSAQQSVLDVPQAQGADGLKEQYLLRYMLDVETRGNQSLLNIAAFTDPTAYRLKVRRPGSDEAREVNVDLLETFDWLLGLTVQHISAPQVFSVAFECDREGRLRLQGRLKKQTDGPWWFRTVTGLTPDGRKALVIWRKRPGGETPEGIERDNLVLDEWFTTQGYLSKDNEFELIYVNGGNNLESLKAPEDTWKVRLIEEDFHRLMFETEGSRVGSGQG